MANTDTEGTVWWVWSQCKGYVTSGHAQHIAYPYGFDVSPFATYNLIDHWRILFAKSQGCSVEAILILFSLLPAMSLVSNLIAGYYVGWQFFRTRSCAFLFAVSAIASSEILLATRTPLANNILVPGLLALGLVFRHTRISTPFTLHVAGMLVGLQMLCNAYNGFVFFVLTGGFAIGMLWGTKRLTSQAIIESWPIPLGAIVGSLPLVVSQLYLITDRNTGEQIRPVGAADQLLNPLVLVSRPYNWLVPLLPDGWPKPEAGWIALPTAIGVLATITLLLRGHRLSVPKHWIYVSIALSMFFALIVYRLPNLGFASRAYFSVLFPLRGVGNYAKAIPLLLSFVAISSFQSLFTAILGLRRLARSTAMVILMFIVSLSLLDSVPNSRSFYERNSLLPVQEFYEQIPGSGDTTVSAHYPDFTYDSEWGFPIRFIQLAQVFTGDTLANGRDFESRYSKDLILPTPLDSKALALLSRRNVSRIYLHRNLMVPKDFDAAVEFLTSLQFIRRDFATEALSYDSELIRPLDVVIFDLRGT